MNYRIKKVKKVVSGDVTYFAQFSRFGILWSSISSYAHKDPERALKECHEHQRDNDDKREAVTYIENLRGIK